jgi:molybdate transport system substrate-binding protein
VGPSGVLRERIQGGEAFDVFASAALSHAQTLTDAGLSSPSALFARNALCIVTNADRALDAGNLAATMVDPMIRIGTSTPIADPAGDYTWELFRKIDAQRPGAFDSLSKKALQLFGGPTTATLVNGRNGLVAALEDHEIDLFVYYCSGAKYLVSASPGLKSVGLPPELSVGPEYGLTVSREAVPEAAAFAANLLSAHGQGQLKAFGFIPANPAD